MGGKYILGVDAGSQSSKILIFDLNGTVVCSGSDPLQPMHLAEGGVVEHPGDDWWDSICRASKKTFLAFDGNSNDIMAVGLCTIRFCRAYLDKDGLLAQPALSWMDSRVSRPYVHENPAIKYACTSSGYITHRFTGNFADTAANHAGMWPMDSDTWDWLPDGKDFDYYGYSRDMLFKLQMPGEISGYVTKEASAATGIPEGIPVVHTANDKAVEALGSGVTGNKTALISLGTYIAAMVQGDRNVKDSVNFWTNYSSVPHKYLYESSGIRRGMWTVSWFKDILGEGYAKQAEAAGMITEKALDLEAEGVPAGSDGLMTVLDWLAPTDKPYRKGVMIGFDGRHTRAHLYRSILEAIALTMKNRTDEMCAELGVTLDEIIVSGGGSNSGLFMQIFADVFGLPAKRNLINGAAGLGSAICAAVAVNAYQGFDDAVKHMVKIKDTFRPNAGNTAMYHQMNTVYKNITAHTDPILQLSYPIFK